MVKLRTRRLFKSSSKSCAAAAAVTTVEVKWEVRPGGMLVQKREDGGGGGGEVIRVRVSTGSQAHEVSVNATSTFGELKAALFMVTGLEPAAQRILYKGKEKEDGDYLHMTGVRDMDKVLLLEDPASKEMKLHAMKDKTRQPMGPPLSPIKV